MNTPVHPLVRYAWYGDDFTGSTDVLDALGRAGVSSVLFLRRPQPQQLTPFFPCTAIGLAGESRSRNPEWMDAHLPGAFEFLRSLQPQVCHYKVCSTFDSAPHIGSIGRALEIGQDLFGTPVVPIVGFAPHLGRYLLFGNLFAATHGEVYRIDRHPVMSCHPVTPMHEADLRLHLARQTTRPIALAEPIALRSLEPGQLLSKIKATKNAAVLFDGFDETDLLRTGRVLSALAENEPVFAVGSSGLTYALLARWRECGFIGAASETPRAAEVDRILVLSGSCSPVTNRQIQHAEAIGFAIVEMNPPRLVSETASALAQARSAAVTALRSGRSVLICTARGPQDPLPTGLVQHLPLHLGRLLADLVQETRVRRIVIAGGDTSSHAVQQLNIFALTWLAPLSPGAPLCRAHSADPALDGLELTLKGGQAGSEDFFEKTRRGV